MNKQYFRFIGIGVILSFLAITTFAGYYIYRVTYRGQPRHVVMPEGAAGVVPGSNVLYEGVIVGEVTSTTPLVHASREVQKKASRSFRKKRNLFGEEQDARSETNHPARMALISFLLQDSSIPVGPSTYATGSAYYITGQGYITLKNRRPTGELQRKPTFLPSSVRSFWIEWFVNLGISSVPYIERLLEFHKQFHNWYHTSDDSGHKGEKKSGREQINSVPDRIGFWRDRARSLDRQLQKTEPVLESIDSTLKSAIDHLPESRTGRTWNREMNRVDQSVMQNLKSIDRSFRYQFISLRYAIQSMTNQAQDIENQTLQNGLID